MDRQKRNQIITIAEVALESTAYECVEVEWDQVDRALRVFIDGPDGIVMDDCLAANKLLSELPEVDEMISGPYRLEVSSPGIDRPLRTTAHFKEVVGKVVNIILLEKVEGRKKGKGILTGVSTGGFLTFNIDSNEWRCPIELLNRANLVYDWN